MKNWISLTIFLGFQISFLVQGQSIDPGSEWRVDYSRLEVGEDWYRVVDYYRDFIDGDTILNEREYYKIYHSGYKGIEYISPPHPPEYDYYDHSLHGYLREEDNKWFMYHQNQDQLIYDFSLETGDTIESFFVGDCSHLTIEEVDSVIIDGDFKKRFHLNNSGVGAQYIIEGIGASTGLFEFFCTFESGSFLICYARNGISLWGESTEECDLAVNINENQENAGLCSVSPNPAKDFTIVNIPDGFGEVAFSIIDLVGRIIYQSSFESSSTNKINLSSCHPGIYLAIIESKGLRQAVKLIIE